ncbi:MAG: hypothetical protein M3291_10125 [Actinomycetota bacterium]|nr:hypothetical protein [Actinomycetota bacterium]
MFLNASIERQFEFVQRKWLNWGQFAGLGNDPDPITGPDGRDFTWQRRAGPRRYPGLPWFVTVCGGEYFFLPSITALRFLRPVQRLRTSRALRRTAPGTSRRRGTPARWNPPGPLRVPSAGSELPEVDYKCTSTSTA